MNNYNDLIKSFLINTSSIEDREELGIFKFGRYFFPEKFGDGFSELHWHMTQLLFSLYNPDKERRTERQSALLCHREAAKSTIGSFLIPIYLTYIKGYKPIFREYTSGGTQDYRPTIDEGYFLLCSETATQGEAFATSIRVEIETNAKLRQVFGNLNPKTILLEDEGMRGAKWTANYFITANRVLFRGVGSGQRMRGTHYRNQRPTFICVDDMYSQHNTATEHMRIKLNNWFTSELLNSLDSRTGKVIWIGTLVHDDTVIKKIKRGAQRGKWKLVDRPIISVAELNVLKDKYLNLASNEIKANKTEVNSWGLANLKTLSWKERHDPYYILDMYAEKRYDNELNWFYQEYMNLPLAPEQRMVDEESFYLTDTIKFFEKNEKQYVSFEYDNKYWEGPVNLELGIDPASSSNEKADDTVMVVAGYARVYPQVKGRDTQGLIHANTKGLVLPIIAHVEGGKYAIYEYKHMKGICEQALKIDKKFKLKGIKIEINGQQEQIARVLETSLQQGILKNKADDSQKGVVSRQEISPSYRKTPFWTEFQNVKKDERIAQQLMPIFHNYNHVICENNYLILNKIYPQVLTLGIGDHDDYADALAIAFKEVSVPDPISTPFDDYIKRNKNNKDRDDDDLDSWYIS